MKPLPAPKRLTFQKRADGYNELRVWSLPASKRKSPRLRIKCGCCDEQVVIYHDRDGKDLEINGVIGSVENWREILLPLLTRKRARK
jgi:hypothetical protein